MRARVLVAVGAWLLGAVAATGGSLLAVSLLGQGIVGGASQQQLTSEAVNRALASEAAESAGNSPSGTLGTAIAATAAASPSTGPARQQVPSPNPDAHSASGSLIASAGGTVVAGCAGAGAYLVSWSPQQGYEVTGVVRGPASTARVTFRSTRTSVTMVISCSGGEPSSATYVHSSHDD